MNKSAFDLSHPIDALNSAREQMRLSLHLLSLDARQKWDELEAQILSVEGKIGQEAEHLSETTATAATDLAAAVKGFVDTHVRNLGH